MSTPTAQVAIITLQQQLIAARAISDRVVECEALGNLGVVYYQGEQWQDAIATCTDYLNLAKRLGHQWQEGIAYYYLGYSYRAIGELAQAVDAFCAAYLLSRQFGNQDVFLPVWEQLNEIVEVYLSKKEFSPAYRLTQWQLETTQKWDNSDLQGWLWEKLGKVHYNSGNYPEAIAAHREMLAIAEALSDNRLKSLAWAWLGCSYRELGELEPALTYFEQRWNMVQELDNRVAQRETLDWLISIYTQLKRYEQAIDCYDKQLRLLREVSDSIAEQNCVYNLARLQFDSQQYQAAISGFDQALNLAVGLADNQEKNANVNYMLGQCYQALGQKETAIAAYQPAVESYLALGIQNWAASGLDYLVNLHRELQEYDKGIDYQQQRLELALKTGDRVAEPSILYGMGNLYNDKKEDAHAIDYYQQALILAQALEQGHNQANACYMLGQVYARLKQKEEAIKYSQQAVSLYLELGVNKWALKGLEFLSDLYRELQEYEKGINCQQQRLKLAKDINDETQVQSSWYDLGCLYRDQHQDEQAIAAFTQALTLAQKLKQQYKTANAHYWLGSTYQRLGQITDAIDQYRQAIKLYEETNTPKWAEKTSVKLRTLEAQQNLLWGDSQSLAKNSYPQYLDFLEKLLNSDGNEEVLSRLLQANLDKLDDKFLQIIINLCRALKAIETKVAQKISDTILDISDSIFILQLGERATNVEISIACYESLLNIFPSHTYSWAYTQNSLGLAYLERIRGQEAENVERAIVAFNAALEVYPRETFPENWAITQMNLGTAYKNRVRGDKAENRELVISSYNAALEILTQYEFPQYWVMMQRNLGLVYSNRIRGKKENNLEMSIEAYTKSLDFYTFENYPEQWARIKADLGNIYLERILGEKVENLEMAIYSYNAILKVYTPEAFPKDWAATQHNLGSAYANRIQGKKAENMEQATLYYQAALQVYTPQAFPQQWAITQANLAEAYRKRIRGNRAKNIEKAIAYYNDVLQIYTCEAFPERWAGIQMSLGFVYTNRIQGDRAENLEKAISYCNEALQIYTCEAFPEQWAATQQNLGNAYQERIRGETAENLEMAISHHNATLRVYSPQKFPEEWSMSQNNLGNDYFYRILGEQAENLEKAIKYHKATLQVRTREAFPEHWATTQMNLGNAYQARIREDKVENVEKAIACYKYALQVRTREAFPEDWATTQINLGNAYQARIRGDKVENVEKAIACYKAALQIYTHEAFPAEWARIKYSLGGAYQIRIQGNKVENLKRAIRFYQEALKIYTYATFPTKCTVTLVSLGFTYYAQSRHYASDLEKQQNALQNAYTTFEQAVDTVEYLRGEITSGDEAKRKLNERWNNLYLGMVDVSLKLGKITDALKYADRSKARNLIESIASRDLYPQGIAEPTRQRLQQLRQAIYQENQRLAQDTNPDYTHITHLREEFQQKSPYKPLEFEQIQNLLDAETAILEWYILLNNQFLTFILTPQTLDFWQSTSEDFINLMEWGNAYLNDYYTDKTQWQAKLPQRLTTLSEILHLSHLLTTLFKQFPTCKKLILIPHRQLHLLPLHALPVICRDEGASLGDEGASLAPLQEWFPKGVNYVPNCQLLQQAQNRNSPEFKRLFAIQNPTEDLIFADLEVETIRNIFPKDKRTTLSRKNATKTALFTPGKNLTQANNLYFSCHGAFNLNSPLDSGLQLADDVLTLAEIITSLNLSQCSLVTLAACETGQVAIDTTDEYISLSSGFILAGSPSVIVTQWSVNQVSTALLLIKTYEILHQHPGKLAIALKTAQMWLRDTTVRGFQQWVQHSPIFSDGWRPQLQAFFQNMGENKKQGWNSHPYQSPYHWAAFCVVGEGEQTPTHVK